MTNHHLARSLARIARQLARLVDDLVDAIPDDSPHSDLPKMEKAILDGLTDGRAQPGKRIARSSGYSYSARLRSTLADMTRRGLLSHSADGYALPKPAASASVNGHH